LLASKPGKVGEMPSPELDLDTGLTRHFAYHQWGMGYEDQMMGNATLL
jgi:hypothetical protein